MLNIEKQTKMPLFFFIIANWDGFHDNETGIFGYTWTVGIDICGVDISDHMDPHAHLFDESEWSHEGIITNLELPGECTCIKRVSLVTGL